MRDAGYRWALGSALACLALAGCGGGGEETQAGGPACEKVAAPVPRRVSLSPPRQEIRPGEKLTAVMKTSCGSFDVALDSERSSKTVNSFVYLARKGFFDGLTFHRIAPGFVIQGGDPLGTGTGGPGYHTDEPPPPNLAYTRGVVAMAKTQVEPPGRSGSQFFVVTVPDAGLSPVYALLGRVSAGLQVVDRIGSLGTAAERPRRTVVIEQVTIERG